MNRGNKKPQGYTIVEVMIVLAVTALLLTSTLMMVRGQHLRTEFTVALNETEQKLRDIMNDVATGFYPSSGSFRCVDDGGTVRIEGVFAADQGTNEDCIFVGKVIQFNPDIGSHMLRVYTVAGLRQKSGTDVTNIQEAKPCLIAPGAPPTRCKGAMPSDLIDEINLTQALRIHSVEFKASVTSPLVSTYGIGIFTTFRNNSSSSPDNIAADIGAIYNVVAGTDSNSFVADITPKIQNGTEFMLNPVGGYRICVDSEGTNQSAAISIGAQTSGISTSVERFNKKGCINA